MATLLLASNPIHGHVGPMLQVAGHLVREGHDVTMVTGTRFQERVEAAGVGFRPLGGAADYDDRRPDLHLPDRAKYSRGAAGAVRHPHDLRRHDPGSVRGRGCRDRRDPSGCRARRRCLRRDPAGPLPGSRAAAGARPGRHTPVAVVACARTVRDGAPARTGSARPRPVRGPRRPRASTRVPSDAAGRRPGTRRLRHATARIRHGSVAALRSIPADRAGEPGVSAPGSRGEHALRRRSAAGGIRRARALLVGRSRRGGAVVHVTQGTIDNHDFGRLVGPTLAALADRPVTVVVSAGGRAVEDLGPLPANARAASYLPYDALLPRTDVFVTNGGFGGVQAALAAGVPVVVAGDTEDKPEVAARVGWTGAGIDLRTGTPSPADVARAVDAVLADRSYRAAASRLAADAARHDALAEITQHLLEAQVL